MRERFMTYLFFALLMLSTSVIQGQVSISSMEEQLGNSYGIEKLKSLNILAAHYSDEGHRKGAKYGKQAVLIGENISTSKTGIRDTVSTKLLADAHFILGQDYYRKEKYREAKPHLQKGKYLAGIMGVDKHDAITSTYLSEIRKLERSGEIKNNIFNKTIGNLKIGERVGNATKDIAVKSEIKKGEEDETNKDFEAAIDHYGQAINMMKNLGDSDGIAGLQMRVASLMDSLNRPAAAEAYLTEAIDDLEKEKIALDTAWGKPTSEAFVLSPESIQAQPIEETSIDLQTTEQVQETKSNLIALAQESARNNDIKKSLSYMKLYQEVVQRRELDSINDLIESRKKQSQILLLTQQRNATSQNLKISQEEKNKAVKMRNYILLIAGLILTSALASLYFYVMKKREHAKLTTAYKDLAVTKDKLEKAESKIVNLLRQQVSPDIASTLLASDASDLGARMFVCVMFLDIREFTPIAEKLSPEELIAFQNQIFGFMIDIVQAYHGNINQLLGDGFMATFGAPISHGNDCDNAVAAARKIISSLQKKSKEFAHDVKIGIGLHAGFVVTGNVGNDKRKQFSVTGNPVIVASRIEQLNKKYNSQLIISREVHDHMTNKLQEIEFVSEKIKGRKEEVEIALIKSQSGLK